MTRWLGLWITVAAVLAASSARAQQSSAPLSLEQLIAEALARNPELVVFGADVAVAQGEVKTARTWANPELTASPGVTHFGGDNGFHGEAEFLQTFEFPGKRSLRRAVAEKNVEVRTRALEGLRNQLTIQVRRTYYGALAWHEIIALREQRLELAREFAAAAHNKVNGGFAPEFEATKADVEVVAARSALRDARAQHRARHAALNALVGRAAGDSVEVVGALLDTAPVIDESKLQEHVLAQNPALLIQNAEVARAQLNVDAVRRSRFPDFTVGPGIEYVRDEQIYWLTFSLPVPLWDRKQGEIAVAEAEYKKSTAQMEVLRREVLRDVSVAAQNLSAARESLSYYTPEFREKLRAALGAAGESYATGRTSLLIYLETQRTYFQTQTDYFETLRSRYDAQAELEAALGVPLAELK
jgi:cobalt-zinc-cadmium efflux system outer membrane protein